LEIPSARLNEWKGLINDTQQLLPSPRLSSSERQRLWKEELEQSLEWSERRNGNNWLNRALQCLHPTPRGFNNLPVLFLLLPKVSCFISSEDLTWYSFV
jgi:hypothetical protein